MFCTNCGNDLKDGALFCTKCGAKIASTSNINVAPSKQKEIKVNKIKEKKKHPILKGLLITWIVMTILTILVVGGIIFLEASGTVDFSYSFGGKRITDNKETDEDTDEDADDEEADDTDDEDLSKKDLDEEDETEEEIEEVEEVVEEILEVCPTNEADYGLSQVLDYTKYNIYDSGIGKFSFGYPGALYSSEYFTDEETDGCYGTVLQEIHYSGSDGSFVNFTLSSRYDNRTYEGMADYVHNYEEQFISYPDDVLYKVEKDGCEIIVTGYTTDEKTAIIYNLTKVDRRYVYQMKIYYPTPSDKDDELHKDYYVETMYRLCEFAESSDSPRLYEDFLDEN